MIKQIYFSMAAIALGCAVVGCAPSPSANSFAAQESMREVQVRMGTVQSVRPVEIRAETTRVGAVTGAVIGGALGSMIGSNTAGNIAGAAGGAAAGGAGAVVFPLVGAEVEGFLVPPFSRFAGGDALRDLAVAVAAGVEGEVALNLAGGVDRNAGEVVEGRGAVVFEFQELAE